MPPPLKVTLISQVGAGDAGGDLVGVGVGEGVGVGDGNGIIFRVTVDSTVPPVPERAYSSGYPTASRTSHWLFAGGSGAVINIGNQTISI